MASLLSKTKDPRLAGVLSEQISADFYQLGYYSDVFLICLIIKQNVTVVLTGYSVAVSSHIALRVFLWSHGVVSILLKRRPLFEWKFWTGRMYLSTWRRKEATVKPPKHLTYSTAVQTNPFPCYYYNTNRLQFLFLACGDGKYYFPMTINVADSERRKGTGTSVLWIRLSKFQVLFRTLELRSQIPN